MDKQQIISAITDLLQSVESQSEKVDVINDLRAAIHEQSPFRSEPVDFVKWVLSDDVVANDYNPNKVAPPEMELLEVSIMNDGYTQPIVTWPNPDKNKVEVIDGFHRNRVGKESKVVRARVNGYLPIVSIRPSQTGANDRMASTIRHNRARGKHQINAMSEIVIELKNRNWSNQRIAKQLGMDEEEVLRLCQISGLEHLFSDQDFSSAWVAVDGIENEFTMLTDDVADRMADYKIPFEDDKERVYHTFDKWECHKAGFYASKKEGMTAEECENTFAHFFKTPGLFDRVLPVVLSMWPTSCEHYLTNKAMNRIAWLGQAAVCYHFGIPSKFCSGWSLLTEDEQQAANETALRWLNFWLIRHGRKEVTMEEALSINRQIELY